MKRGKFIVLEGGEGAGKTTVASFLKRLLEKENVLVTRGGGSPFGEQLRALHTSDDATASTPASRFFLSWAMHIDHAQNTVTPALSAGVNVISDRFDASNFAYQVYGDELLQLANLFWRIRKEVLNKTVPDLYIFLDVPATEGFLRLKKAGKKLDHFEKRPLDFHERVQEGYQEFFKQVPHVVVDANRPLEEVQTEILSVILAHAGIQK